MNKKMNLKRIKKININIFNNKNFLIYLISFFIVGIIIGIIFFSFLNKEDLSLIANNVNKSLTINDNYNYINNLIISLKNNISLNLLRNQNNPTVIPHGNICQYVIQTTYVQML